MKAANIFFTILLVFIAFAIYAQHTTLIKLDNDREIVLITPNSYGAFVEPIRTVVYEKIYEPTSSFSDENGFRNDFFSFKKHFSTFISCAFLLSNRNYDKLI